jgi:hypothetical protein
VVATIDQGRILRREETRVHHLTRLASPIFTALEVLTATAGPVSARTVVVVLHGAESGGAAGYPRRPGRRRRAARRRPQRGTPEDDAAARQDAWPKVVVFLARTLTPGL